MPLQNAFTKRLYKTPLQNAFTKRLYKMPLQNAFTKRLYKKYYRLTPKKGGVVGEP
jgi:hypothetical protein